MGSRRLRVRSRASFHACRHSLPISKRGWGRSERALAALPTVLLRHALPSGLAGVVPRCCQRCCLGCHPHCLWHQGAKPIAHAGWCRYKTARPIRTKLRAAKQVAQGHLAPSDSGLWCLAKNVGTRALNRHARPAWLACHCQRPNSQTPWRFVQKTAANNIQCPLWLRRCRCLCKCGFWWDRHLAVHATDCETWHAPLRPWEIRGPATSALRARGTNCAACLGRRCEWSQFRCQTNQRGRALASPWETNQSGRRGPHIHQG